MVLKTDMRALPENWDQLSGKQKEVWFLMYYGNYVREGEVDGIQSDAPQEIRKAFDDYLKSDDCTWVNSVHRS